MGELELIRATLDRAASRRRTARALRGLWRGLFAGSSVWLAALAAWKFAPAGDFILQIALVTAALCPPAGFLIGWARSDSRDATARWIDARENLRERLGTALEISARGETSPWAQLVLADAAAHAGLIDPRRLVTFSLPPAGRWAALVLAMALGLGFVPEFRSGKFRQQQADAANIREAGKQLANLTKQELQQRKPALEPAQKSLEAVAALADSLQKQNLTRSEALRALAEEADKIKEQMNELAKDSAPRKTGGANSDVKNPATPANTDPSQAKSGKSAADRAGKLASSLESARQAAKELAEKSGAGEEAAKDKLAAALAELSKDAQQAGPALPQLDAAADALAANDTDRLQKELADALAELKEQSAASAPDEQAAQAPDELAQQLKSGDLLAAQRSLEKFAAQLQSGKLSQEELKKILDAILNAKAEASELGKTEQSLDDAASEMKSGQNSEAAKSLAQAAQELAKAVAKSENAKSLARAMQGLAMASKSIGSGQGMGRSPGGMTPGGPKSSAKSGSGDSWNPYGTPNPTGNVRPGSSTAALSAGQRDAQLSAGLTPAKIKGQFSPGAPTPSITLKGVSIRGQSKVQYEESVAAAQSEAQSALSQEKIPRAYQGAVKDYFDDLKK